MTTVDSPRWGNHPNSDWMDRIPTGEAIRMYMRISTLFIPIHERMKGNIISVITQLN